MTDGATVSRQQLQRANLLRRIVKSSFAAMFNKIREHIYYSRRATAQLNTRPSRLSDPDLLDVVTIAFNNPKVVEHQIRLIRKNLADTHSHVVADNSTDPQASEVIRRICGREKAPYILLPRNPYTNAMSHGSAMTWMFRNYLRKRGARYFGFIDHDIFPLRATSILAYLQTQPCYGHVQQRGTVWYLWAGFSFFNSHYVPQDLDFTSGSTDGEAVDTGGMNWKSFYSKIEKERIRFPTHEYRSIRTTDGTAQSDRVEVIGDWLHIFNASGWMLVPDPAERDRIIDEIISDL